MSEKAKRRDADEACDDMADSILPEVFIGFKEDIPLHLYTDMFSIWYRSNSKIWSNQRWSPDDMENSAM